MPAYVKPRDTAGDYALRGVTAALEGKLSGETFNEGRRQFNVTTQEKARQEDSRLAEQARESDAGRLESARQFDTGLKENARQFDAEESFKYMALVHAATQGRLGREQEARLEGFRQKNENFRRLEELATSRRNVDEQEATNRYRIKKEHEQRMSALDVDTTRALQSEDQKLAFAQAIKATYGADPTQYTQAQWDEIRKAGEAQFLGTGATTGKEGVVQATPEAREALFRELQNRVTNYEQHQDKLVEDAKEAVSADVSAKAGAEFPYAFALQSGNAAGLKTSADGIGNTGGTPLYKVLSGPIDPRTGSKTLDPQWVKKSLSPDQSAELMELEARLEAEAASIQVGLNGGMDDLTIKAIVDSYSRENKSMIDEAFSSPAWANSHPTTQKELKAYYEQRAKGLGNYYGDQAINPVSEPKED